MSSKLDLILRMLPEHWDTLSVKSKVGAIVNAIATEFDIFGSQLDTVDGMVGIDTTYGTDLDTRWGKLLSIPRNNGELDDTYRSRIKLSIIRLMGGTDDAIKYGVSSLFRQDMQSNYENYINVYDAWLYGGNISDRSYGNAVCVINIDAFPSYDSEMEDQLRNAINTVKASGINVSLVMYGAYDEVSNIRRDSVYTATDKIIDVILPDGFTTNDSTTNGDDNTIDGTFVVDVGMSEYDLPSHIVESSMEVSDGGADVDDSDTIRSSDDYDAHLYTTEVEYGIIATIPPIADDNEFISTNSATTTNTSLIADGFELAIICDESESCTDIIIQSGQPNIVINY